MRKSLAIVFVFGVGTCVHAQTVDHTDVVRAVRAAVIASGVDVDQDDCSRFEITKHVAVSLSSEGAGLLSKPGGSNCDGFATDIIAYPTGAIVDILGSGPEGPNSPHWLILAPVDPSRWRAPVAFSEPVPVPVLPSTSPIPLQPDALGRIEGQLTAIRADIAQLKAQEQVNSDSILHEIKAFRDAAGNVIKQLIGYLPSVIGALGLLKK